MESQPQNPEFRINPENFHPCNTDLEIKLSCCGSQIFYHGILEDHEFSYNPFIKLFLYTMIQL